jgi:GntR family transcriptional repressor for pyruvate dehydrogenase complex
MQCAASKGFLGESRFDNHSYDKQIIIMQAAVLPVTAAQRVRLSDTVVDQLLSALGEGRLAPGAELPAESELARSFGVSKTVVREALGRLAVMGVVHIQQGRPTTVCMPSAAPLTALLDLTLRLRPDGVRQAIELRRALETEIAGLAAENATPHDIDELHALLGRMREHAEGLDTWVEADYAFHRKLAEISGNELMHFLMQAIEKPAREAMRRLTERREMRNAPATLARHVAIVEAIAARDPTAAKAAMHVHFDASRRIVHAIIKETTK